MHHPADPVQLPCASTSLRKTARAVGRLYDAEFAPYGLSTNQFAILRSIRRLGEPTLSRLSESMVMDRTSLYRALAPMERDRWIRFAPGGGRSKTVALTDEGRAVMERATQAWDGVQTRFVEAIGPDRWAELAAVLKDLTHAARGLDGRPAARKAASSGGAR